MLQSGRATPEIRPLIRSHWLGNHSSLEVISFLPRGIKLTWLITAFLLLDKDIKVLRDGKSSCLFES